MAKVLITFNAQKWRLFCFKYKNPIPFFMFGAHIVHLFERSPFAILTLTCLCLLVISTGSDGAPFGRCTICGLIAIDQPTFSVELPIVTCEQTDRGVENAKVPSECNKEGVVNEETSVAAGDRMLSTVNCLD